MVYYLNVVDLMLLGFRDDSRFLDGQTAASVFRRLDFVLKQQYNGEWDMKRIEKTSIRPRQPILKVKQLRFSQRWSVFELDT